MGGFSDNYECGYWGDETPPMQKSKDKKFHRNRKLYVEKVSSKHRFLIILLTKRELLTINGQEHRDKLCQAWDEDIALEVRHNREHEEDNKTLEFYYESVFIGAVQKVFEEDKIDNTSVVNDFCFNGDELQNIEGFWDDENFYLKKKNESK